MTRIGTEDSPETDEQRRTPLSEWREAREREKHNELDKRLWQLQLALAVVFPLIGQVWTAVFYCREETVWRVRAAWLALAFTGGLVMHW